MRRKIWNRLQKWKQDPDKKALMITGARQTGKTYIIRKFARAEYENFVEINFIENGNAEKIFSDVSNVDMIITNLTAYTKETLVPGKTLIFFDEIQECPAARTAIKFLVEDGRFDYIESGSLLGVSYKEVKSYPVGYEQTIRMFPMDFEEFLDANGVKDETVEYLRKCFSERKPVSDSVHETISHLFRYYVITGGMPAVVQCFVNTHDIGRVERVQRDILELYRQDISRYSREDKAKIRDIFDRIPSELSEKNKRFILANVRKTARMDRYESAFLWLRDAGVALPCYNITEPRAPLALNEKRNLMKLYLADTGLLCAASLGNIQFEILQNHMDVNMGGILENVFAQIFTANGFGLAYFDRKNKGEVDFILQRGRKVLPAEIKSGGSYKTHAALNALLDVPEWNLEEAYVFCEGNVEQDGKVLYLPWYMAMFLEQEEIKDDLVVDVDLTGLGYPTDSR